MPAIENVEDLKIWLVKKLEPICDADPVPLAKYCVALAKKDKPADEHKTFCNDQLEVFLQDETAQFVDELFETLSSKSYIPAGSAQEQLAVPAYPPLPPEAAPAVPPPAPPPVPPTEVLPQSQDQPPPTQGTTETLKPVDASVPIEQGPLRNDGAQTRERGSRSPPRTRSRSPRSLSPRRRRREEDRNRSRRDDRDRDRYDRDRRPYRDNYRDRDYHRSYRGSGRYNSRRGDSPRRSKSRSRSPPSPKVSSAVTIVGRDGHQETVDKGQPKPRCRDFDEKGFCMRGDFCPFDHGVDPLVVDDLSIPSAMQLPGDRIGPSSMLAQPPPPSVIPPPPGVPPPPFGPPIPPNIPPFRPPLGASQLVEMQRRGLPPPSLSVPPPPPPGIGPGPILRPPVNFPPVSVSEGSFPSGAFPPGEPGYNPEQPEMNIGNDVGFLEKQRQQRAAPHNLRNLVSIDMVTTRAPSKPTAPNATSSEAPRRVASPLRNDERNNSRRFVVEQKTNDTSAVATGGSSELSQSTSVSRQPDLRQRLSGSNASNFNRKFVPNNRTLEIRKIPRELNNIAKLNEHFQKFGTIVNLQVAYKGDIGAALLTFATHLQAKAAHSSSEAVLGNRFIKLFWHVPDDNSTENQSPVKKPFKERIVIPSKEKLSIVRNNEKPPVQQSTTGTSISKTVYNPAATARKVVEGATPSPALAARKLASAKEAMRKRNEETRKAAMQKQVQIQKQKQELVNMMIQKQKALISKLEAMKGSPTASKQPILDTIKSLAASIEKAKKEQLPKSRTKAQTQKELLDTELDLYNQSVEGQDTTELKKRVAALRQEAATLGLLSGRQGGIISRGRGGGRGRGRGRGRGAPIARRRSSRSHTVLDKRPRQLRVSGFDAAEKEEVLVHLNGFGELEHIDYRDDTNDYIISYKTRLEAEVAATRGAVYNGKTLSMSWHIQETLPPAPAQVETDEEFPGNDEEENLDEDNLLQEEEEEEDEEDDDESRAWRR